MSAQIRRPARASFSSSCACACSNTAPIHALNMSDKKIFFTRQGDKDRRRLGSRLACGSETTELMPTREATRDRDGRRTTRSPWIANPAA